MREEGRPDKDSAQSLDLRVFPTDLCVLFAVLTGEPNELTAPIHDRMTTFLEPRDYEEYLTPTDLPFICCASSQLRR